MPPPPAPIASRGHLAVVIGCLLFPTAWVLVHSVGPVSLGTGIAEGTSGHASNIPFYLLSIAANVGISYLVWIGIVRRGGRLRDLLGDRYRDGRQVAVDAVLTAAFLVMWEAFARGLGAWLAPASSGSEPDTRSLLPTGVAEIAMWVVVSLVAGFCEELIFRGYLQRQFASIARSRAVGVALQAVLFGAIHLYQGWRRAVLIAGLGVLYGAFASSRRNLAPNMVAHALTDLYEGWWRWI